MRQTKVPNLNFATYFRGLLQYLPSDYNAANTSIKHPLIIYFHGRASRGNGNVLELCRLFKDNGNDDLATFKSLPGRIETNPADLTQGSNKYIVVSPQFNRYDRVYPEPAGGNFYPSAAQVEMVIDYVLARFPGKINDRKIYLTGYSNGANMIMEYVASSLQRASRIAAVMPVALCSQLNHPSNTAIGVSASNIANAKLKTWFVQCAIDNPCGLTSQAWVDGIKAVPGNIAPRYTVLKDQNPATLYNCSDSLLHDAWSRAYDPNFRASFINGTGANDGVNLNMYQWFAAQTNVVLPVTLKEYSVRLTNANVEIAWTTSDEKNNASFTIERSASDQVFTPIATIAGAGDFTGDRKYSFTDEHPLTGLSHYRLSQTDVDGKKTYFEIRRIMNRKNGTQAAVMITPNPFANRLSAFLNLDKPQKVSATVTDLNGKVLSTMSGIYGQGSSEIAFSLETLARGVYLLKINGESFRTVEKVVKK